jgi:aldose sugar dehydrogenase
MKTSLKGRRTALRHITLGPVGASSFTLLADSVLAQGTSAGSPATPATPVIPFSEGPALEVKPLFSGLRNPWGLAQLPDGRFLVTERGGRLSLLAPDGVNSSNYKLIEVQGSPLVRASGQGGLLDVCLSPKFETDATIYLSYAVNEDNSRTAVTRARLQGNRLTDNTVIFQQDTSAPDGYHFGSRLVFDRDGFLFVTTGDRYMLKNDAQKLSNHIGKVIRISSDGKPAPGNPFLGRADAKPEIWSYGHRNMQGAALHPLTGQLWTNEHGARGGDEINVTLPGRNFGWPAITHGVDYSGLKISNANTLPGMEQPAHVWVPSIAASGMAFDGRATRGDTTVVWVGGLRSQILARVTFEKQTLGGVERQRSLKEERFLQTLNQRIRDVRYLSNGRLAVLTDASNGALLQVTPPA